MDDSRERIESLALTRAIDILAAWGFDVGTGPCARLLTQEPDRDIPRRGAHERLRDRAQEYGLVLPEMGEV